MEYTEEEIQLLKNLKARGASNEEAKSALQSSRRASSVQQEEVSDPVSLGADLTQLTEDQKSFIKFSKKMGISQEETLQQVRVIQKVEAEGGSKEDVEAALLESAKANKEETSFEQIEDKTPIDYVAGGIADIGKPIVKAAEFVEEKAITPAVEGAVGAMETITAPLQSGLRNLIGEEKITDMQGGMDNALNNAGAATVKWWEGMDNDTQNRLKMTFEALEPILIVTGAAKAKTALKGATKNAGKTGLQLLKSGDDAAVKTVLKEGKKAEKLVKSALKKDKLLEKPFIREITNATDDELKGFDKMLNIANSNVGKVGADIIPEDIVGKEITKQAKFIYDEMSKIGRNKGKVVDKIGSDKIDVSDAYNSFVDSLEKQGVNIKKGKKMLSVNDFADSKIRDNLGTQKDIQKVLEWFNPSKKGGVANKTVKQIDNYRANLFDTLDLDKTQPILSNTYKKTLESIRTNLAKPIEVKAPRYAKLNKQYAQTRNSFTDITKMLGFKGKIDDIAKEATRGGEISRRLLGRASAKPAKIMDQLQATSKKLGYKPNVSIKKMASFAERMSQKFGTPQATSFESQISTGMQKAKNVADVATDLTMGGTKGVAKQALSAGKALQSKFAKSAAEKGTKRIKDVIGATRKISAAKAAPKLAVKKSVPKLISGLAKSTAKDIAKDPKAAIRGAAASAKKSIPLLGMLGASRTGRSLGF